MGMLPLPEIQYLAYFHNACDQIRGEAASLQFFSNGQYRNPMVMRVASLGYQRGFGGHFHNDNSITALRDIPGLVVGCPSRGDDAGMMLRPLMALAKVNGRVRSEEPTSELQPLMRISYAVFCLKKKNPTIMTPIDATARYITNISTY